MSPSNVEFPIHLEHVTKRFKNKIAVNDLSLRIARGSTFGFIGLNGAGKTTAIRMMVGLLGPDSGTIEIAGFRVPESRDSIKTRIGYVPDRPHVYPWMRVDKAVEFTRSFYSRWNQKRCDELMQIFRLDSHTRVKHLSKGQGAKLSLLLAICHEPEVLILDEPTSGLDPLIREEFLEGVLAATAEHDQTVLFSSHTLADVQRMADSVGLLHEGKLLLHSPVDALLDRVKRIRAVLVDENAPRQLPPGLIRQQVAGREWLLTLDQFTPAAIEFVRSHNRVSHLDVEDLSLDEVFKDVVRGQLETV
jgi:ABC-2 type transport system ATP-binding protein